MQEKENILRIMEGTKAAIKREDVVMLKNLSNQTVHTASTTQDPDNIAVAVIVYSLSKVIERKKYQQYKEWGKFYGKIISNIDNSIKFLRKNDEINFRASIEAIRKDIDNLSGNLKWYIKDVFRKASINKASRIYEHGISMEKTAKLLGISLWELADYAGQTGIGDTKLCKTCDTKSRIKLAMDMFS